jgi:single-strand DNA-binding protein
MLPTISGVGRLTQDPELRFAPSGVAVLTVNLAFNSRKLNKQTNEWEDSDVFFVRATAFKQLAENAAESLSKGVEVHVSGRLKTEQWNDKQSGEKRSATALLLDSIGPNLSYATASVQRAGRSSDGGGPPAHGNAGGQDPWGAPADQLDSAPF